ncbi:MAG: tetratricopeptide repeat protein [Muribaculaceae bacterium]|nr:tetratricopeptide repeat protein [Muribaculaceae bacterium]
MKDKVKYSLPVQIKKLLDAGRYKDSFTLLRRRLTEVPVAGALNRVSQSESTYRFMLDYFARGLADPGRDAMLASIRHELLDIAQKIDKDISATDSPELYFSTLRMCRLRPVSLAATVEKLVELKAMADLALSSGQYPVSVMAQIEAEEEKIFNVLWTADFLNRDEYEAVEKAALNGSLPLTTISLAISAVGLSLMRYYSREAFLMLIVLAKAADYRIAARALVTLILAMGRWADYLSDDSKLIQALQSLPDIEGMSRRIRNVVKSTVRTRDTDRVSRKMQREVIPGLMQFGPDIIQRLKKTSEESSFADLEANPEWEEILRDTGLEEKLRELTEMQSDGADVMMVAFSNLKNFPFFRQVRNWFLPFTVQHPMLAFLKTIDDDGVSSMLEMSGLMCDSDKYSFAFSLSSMPESQRGMMLSQMRAQTEQMKEQIQDLKALKAGMEFEDEVTRYFRDLYRFHKLFPKRAEFFDPFAEALDFTAIPVISEVMETADDVVTIAEFYFKRGYYQEALPLLQNVARTSGTGPHVWEKIGFCLEKAPNGNREAIESYMKAQLIYPDSRWIARRLGICYRREADYRNALEYLELARPTDGSFERNLSLLIADTMMEAGKWEEALRELYRIDYETPDDPEIIRRMARCSFRSSDLDKAESLFKTIPNIDMSEDDYRMMGHIAFLRKDITEAVRFYKLTVRPNDEKRLWKSQIISDLDILISLGGSRSELLLLLESLAYTLER